MHPTGVRVVPVFAYDLAANFWAWSGILKLFSLCVAYSLAVIVVSDAAESELTISFYMRVRDVHSTSPRW